MARLIRLRLQQVLRRRDRRTDPLWAEKELSPKLKDRFALRRSSGKSRRGSAHDEQRVFDVAMECFGNRIRVPTARSQRTAMPVLKEPLTAEAVEDSAGSSVGS